VKIFRQIIPSLVVADGGSSGRNLEILRVR